MEQKNDGPKLRILHVLSWHPLESAGIFSKRQIKALSGCGHTNGVFFLKGRFNPFSLLKQYIAYRKLIRSFKPDIIHVHYGTITGFFASRYRKAPVVVTFQGSDINFTTDVSGLRNWLGKKMSYATARRASYIICVSKLLADQVPVNRTNIEVMPVGVDTGVFRPIDRNEAKNKLELSQDKNYLFFNANNPSIKRLDIAKEVEAKLSDLNAELLVLNGATDPEIIPFYLNACSCVLMCSDSEGSPMVVKEAMACNVPVISTDVGDVKQRIEDTENCYIAAQNAEDLAKAIRKVIATGDMRSDGRAQLRRQGLDSRDSIQRLIQAYGKAQHVFAARR